MKRTINDRKKEAEKAIKTFGRMSQQSYWPLIVLEIVRQYEELYAETEHLRQVEMFRDGELVSKKNVERKIGV